MKYWTTTREWEGQTVAVLASGPSMTRDAAAKIRAAGIHCIAVNNQGIPTNGKPAMAPWADILYAADYSWWYNNKEAALKFEGKKVAIDTQNDRWPWELLEAVVFLRHGGVDGFDERPGYVRTGGNSGYQGVHLAVSLGARRIIMCGFDMHSKNGEHWFGSHHWKRNYASRYDLFLNRFKQSAPALLERAEIINTTPGSALKCFPMMSLEEALNGLPSVPGKTSKDEGVSSESRTRTETPACPASQQAGA
jgi:hypothetical protein